MSFCATQKIILTFLSLILLNVILALLCVRWFPSAIAVVLPILNIIGGIIIAPFLRRWLSDLKNQKLLLIANLEKLREETGFTKLDYHNGKIVKVAYEEPLVEYSAEINRILEKHNLHLMAKKATKETKEVQSKAETSMKEFQEKIKQNLETIQLKKSMTIGEPLAENTYSFPRICQAVFDENNGEKSGFDITDGYLWHGDTKIARDNASLGDLKDVLEKMVKNGELIEKVNVFRECKKLLDSGELFLQFKSELKEIINQLRWNNP